MATTDPLVGESGVVGSSVRRLRLTAAVEVVAACVVVAADLAVPTLVLLIMMGASLLVRRERFDSLGLARFPKSDLIATMLLFAAVWSLIQLSVVMPIANHLSGTTQDLSDFKELEGNVAMLVALLVLSWTLAALGEELAYRGYLLTRVRQLFGPGRAALLIAVMVSSILFGIAHAEQGGIGIAITTLDALAFSCLRFRYKTLWASVFAHGFNNTIGFLAFFLVGPIHGLW